MQVSWQHPSTLGDDLHQKKHTGADGKEVMLLTSIDKAPAQNGKGGKRGGKQNTQAAKKATGGPIMTLSAAPITNDALVPAG